MSPEVAGHYVQCWPDIVSVPGRELRPYRPVSSSGCTHEKTKIYYDNGQIEISKILASVFTVLLPEVEIKRVVPSDYRLFQAADMFCSMELIRLKAEASAISASEMEFFGSIRDLKKNYLNPLDVYEWN